MRLSTEHQQYLRNVTEVMRERELQEPLGESCDGCGKKTTSFLLRKDGSRWCEQCQTNPN
jgi:formamidopyrimidine-DNA glycosylase